MSHTAEQASVHTGERPYECVVCKSRFSFVSSLKRHKKLVHSDERPYKCTICSLTFKIKSALTVHMRTHDPSKKNQRKTTTTSLQCEICSKRFAVRRHLESHFRTHTGEKPFQCKICAKSFSQADHLKRHMTLHSEENLYKCALCPREFPEKHHLTRHNTFHSGTHPFACDICWKRFKLAEPLDRHRELHKPENRLPCDQCDWTFTTYEGLKKHKERKHSDRQTYTSKLQETKLLLGKAIRQGRRLTVRIEKLDCSEYIMNHTETISIKQKQPVLDQMDHNDSETVEDTSYEISSDDLIEIHKFEIDTIDEDTRHVDEIIEDLRANQYQVGFNNFFLLKKKT